jgi:hypothetical protein
MEWVSKDITRMRVLYTEYSLFLVIRTRTTDIATLPACTFLPYPLLPILYPILLVSLHSSFYRLSFPLFVFVSSSLLVLLPFRKLTILRQDAETAANIRIRFALAPKVRRIIESFSALALNGAVQGLCVSLYVA